MGSMFDNNYDSAAYPPPNNAHTRPVQDMKYDKGKYYGALPVQDFPLALKAVAEVGTFGANKYERHSWSTVKNGYQRYEDAFHRHMLAHYGGERFDEETKLMHLAHMAWNILALLQMELNNVGGTYSPSIGDRITKTSQADRTA